VAQGPNDLERHDHSDPTVGSVRSDSDLLACIRAGDEDALGELYDRYGGIALALALRLLGDRGMAEDIVQESFLAVWRRGGTFDDGRGSVRAWLLSIVRNASIDRRRGRHRHQFGEVALDDIAYRLASSDVWDDVSRRIDQENVRRALVELPAEQRETLELAYFGGLTQAEIAERTGQPLGTIKSRARLGLRRLERVLRAGYENRPDESPA
jgi:RNA polymerase sigma-70 factor, ECF subfamily